jgi:glutamate--cysteine ligase
MATNRLASGEERRPILSHWVDHLTTLFPEVRVKRVLELRGADVVPLPHMMALPAIWVGLLYDAGACDAAWQLTKGWTFAQRLDFQEAVARKALEARGPDGRTALELGRDLLAIARKGLAAWQRVSGLDESSHLDPLEDIVSSGRTLAERALEVYRTSGWDPESLVRFWQVA